MLHPFRFLPVALLILLVALPARAGGDPSDGHSHGAEVGSASSSVGPGVVTTAAMTGRFEVVLKHAPVRGGEPYTGTLYLADYATNGPVSGATLTISVLGAAGAPFVAQATAEPGIYAVTRAGGFPADGRYDLTVAVAADGVSDLVLLSGLYVGPVAAPAEPVAAPPGGGAGSVPWLWILIVGALAAGLAFFLVRSARQRRQAPAPEPPTVPALAPSVPSRRPESEPSLS